MSKVKLILPIASVHGAISRTDDVYLRTYRGKTILQHKPRMLSPKRIAACIAFGERFGSSRRGKQRTTNGASTDHSIGERL